MLSNALSDITRRFAVEFTSDRADEIEILSELKVPLRQDELERLETVKSLGIVDTNQADPTFDRITNLAAKHFKIPIAMVVLVDVSRCWCKSKIGVEYCELKRDLSFCSHLIAQENSSSLVMKNILENDIHKFNPFVTSKRSQIRFYAGVSITIDSRNVGTFCIIDTKPRPEFDDIQLNSLIHFAGLVTELIEITRRKKMESDLNAANLSVSLLYSLKFPLETLNILSEEMRELFPKYEETDDWVCIDSNDNNNNNNNNIENLEKIVELFKRNLFILSEIMENNLAVAENECLYSNGGIDRRDFKVKDFKESSGEELEINIKSLFFNINNILKFYRKNISLEWYLEEKYLFSTYSAILIAVLHTSILHYIRIWTKIDVIMFYQPRVFFDINDLLFKKKNLSDGQNLETQLEKEQYENIADVNDNDVGYLVINVQVGYRPISENEESPETAVTPKNRKGKYRRKSMNDDNMLSSVKETLKSVSGGCKLKFPNPEDKKNENEYSSSKTLLIWIPCKVVHR